MLTIAEAQGIVLAHVRLLPTVPAPLADALFQTLAAPVCCDLDDPPFDRALMDGYAVRAADVATVPVTLKLIGQIPAGAVPEVRVEPRQAVQINTGAPMPHGADAVVRIESAESGAGTVLIRESVASGQFVTPRAAYAHAGKTVLQTGTQLTPVNLGVAATAGAATVTVYRQPTVAILATGNELVGIDRRPVGAQIRNSNQHLLEALVLSAHCLPHRLDPSPDDADLLRHSIAAGLKSDVLCITGGVSAGAFDFVPVVLRSLGVAIHVHKISIKPGRPAIFGTAASGTLVFALPGNPVSAFIGFELLVRPALAAAQGRPGALPEVLAARLEGRLPAAPTRQSYHPAAATVGADGQWRARRLSWGGSGDSMGIAGANAVIVRPIGAPQAADGDAVSMFLLDRYTR